MMVNKIPQSAQFRVKHVEELSTEWLNEFNSVNSNNCTCAVSRLGAGEGGE